MEQAHDGNDGAIAQGDGGLSRRTLIGGGLGAAGALGLAGGLAGTAHVMAAPLVRAGDVTDAIEAPVDGLVYLPIDAYAFDVAGTGSPTTFRRIYQDATGTQPLTPPAEIFASLPIPIGSVVKKINVSYQGQPIVSLTRRALGSSTLGVHTDLLLTAAGGGAKSQTFTVDATLTAGASYAVRAFCSAGDSILGVEIGYIPAAQAFVPYTGTAPRVFDSRDTTKFAANEERVIDLSSRLIPTARAAVINLTATQTDGPGFLAAFTDGPYPNNSTLNFTGANATVANGAVVTMTAGKIKVRTGPAGSHVIVDVIGSLL
jgi:hypothetical protein